MSLQNIFLCVVLLYLSIKHQRTADWLIVTVKKKKKAGFWKLIVLQKHAEIYFQIHISSTNLAFLTHYCNHNLHGSIEFVINAVDSIESLCN